MTAGSVVTARMRAARRVLARGYSERTAVAVLRRDFGCSCAEARHAVRRVAVKLERGIRW